MAKLRLSLAISDYVHTRDIADGLINPVGIELIVNNLVFEQAAFRFGANREFDVSEFSFANYCAIYLAPMAETLLRCLCFRRECSGTRRSISTRGRTSAPQATSGVVRLASRNGHRLLQSMCEASSSTMRACRYHQFIGCKPVSTMPAVLIR